MMYEDDLRQTPPTREPAARSCVVTPSLGEDISLLQPLLEFLRSNNPVQSRLEFPRGVLLEDGRLDLCKQGVGVFGAAALRLALSQNSHVKDILLGADWLGATGVSDIAELAKKNPHLRTIYLGCNAMGDEGAKALAYALTQNDSVRGLWLKRNNIAEQGAKAIADMLTQNNTLRTIDLVSNNIGTSGLQAMVDAINSQSEGIESIYLCGNNLGSEGARIASNLMRAKHVKALYLGGNDIGDEGASHLAKELGQNRSLVVLSVPSNNIGSEGAKKIFEAVAQHPTLETLEIGYLTSTEVIGAKSNQLGEKGTLALIELLKAKTTLRAIDVAGSGLDISLLPKLVEVLIEHPFVHTVLLGQKLNSIEKPGLTAILCRNMNKHVLSTKETWRDDIRRIKSVYRTAMPGRDPNQPKANPNTPASLNITAEQLEQTLETLNRIKELGSSAGRYHELSDLLFQVHTVAKQTRRFISKERRFRLISNKMLDRNILDTTAIRSGRKERWAQANALVEKRTNNAPTEENPSNTLSAATQAGPTTSFDKPVLSQSRACYICKTAYRQVDSFYDALCPQCAQINRDKRNQSAPMENRTVLITGGRIKIGFEMAKKLLRSGANVIVTTRFAVDSKQRFEQEPDFESWRHRLTIYRLDLRYLLDVEQFAEHIMNTQSSLDALIHNAAQTVARPPHYYADLIEKEPLTLPHSAEGLLARWSETEPLRAAGQPMTLGPAELPMAGLSSVNKVELDEHGQPIDRRVQNSWRLKLGEIETRELAAVHAVGALAPFVLNNQLRPLLIRAASSNSNRPYSFILHVSAMEGQFNRFYKSAFHPHTNMAKASLNMLTRTSAQELYECGVLMNSVDTGWITNENPQPIASKMSESGFSAPLDEIDGAARVLDPIFSVVNGAPPIWGKFLKDYAPTDW